MKNTANKAPRVFLDTNILMDYILFRGDEALASEYILDSSLDRRFSLHIAAHSLTNIFYALRKSFSVAERNQIIQLLCALCNVQPVSSENIIKAIDSGFTTDLEDALQIQCAVESDCDYFVTRDQELFEKCPVRTLLPHELISELSL
ncbi:MAG: PIN domain-containing protein [Mogibacterium sp.]|nr:PIN domain-containing protein [Mogibacterium sp.]